jgi:hypothetical protein
MAKFNTGKGDAAIYPPDGKLFINVDGMISNKDGYVEPKDWYQFTDTDDISTLGQNNVTFARAVTVTYIFQMNRNKDVDEDFYFGWEDNLMRNLEEHVKNPDLKSENTNIYLFTMQGFVESVREDINYDFNLIFVAIILVALYTFLFLGSFTPMHCRCLVTLAGLICVGLAYLSGFGMMYALGGKSTGVH